MRCLRDDQVWFVYCRLFKDHFWEVSTDSGTNIMYQWSMWSLSNGRSGANITGATYGVMDKVRIWINCVRCRLAMVSPRLRLTSMDFHLLGRIVPSVQTVLDVEVMHVGQRWRSPEVWLFSCLKSDHPQILYNHLLTSCLGHVGFQG